MSHVDRWVRFPHSKHLQGIENSQEYITDKSSKGNIRSQVKLAFKCLASSNLVAYF